MANEHSTNLRWARNYAMADRELLFNFRGSSFLSPGVAVLQPSSVTFPTPMSQPLLPPSGALESWVGTPGRCAGHPEYWPFLTNYSLLFTQPAQLCLWDCWPLPSTALQAGNCKMGEADSSLLSNPWAGPLHRESAVLTVLRVWCTREVRMDLILL